MPGARDHLDQPARDLARSRMPDAASERDPRPSITAAADPRLAVASAGTHADLMRVQRSAGNAAVASLVAPAVQRAITIDELTAPVQGPAQAPVQGPAQAPVQGPAQTAEQGPAPTAAQTAEQGPAPTAAQMAEQGPGAASPGDAGGEANHTINAAHIGLNAPIVSASGIVRAETVIADTIIASTYTPGVGNVM